MFSHAHVESAKAINLNDLSSDWINLKEKNIKNRTCSIACGKFFSFHGMFSLCAVNTYVEKSWKPALMHIVENVKSIIEPHHDKTCYIIMRTKRRRSTCASVQSDQRLCCPLPKMVQ